jgi:hypothetical protein
MLLRVLEGAYRVAQNAFAQQGFESSPVHNISAPPIRASLITSNRSEDGCMLSAQPVQVRLMRAKRFESSVERGDHGSPKVQ